jgi:hypothetical protein
MMFYAVLACSPYAISVRRYQSYCILKPLQSISATDLTSAHTA